MHVPESIECNKYGLIKNKITVFNLLVRKLI